jgi:hypothetical protein
MQLQYYMTDAVVDVCYDPPPVSGESLSIEVSVLSAFKC